MINKLPKKVWSVDMQKTLIWIDTFCRSINLFPNKHLFLRVCSTSLLKTLREKEKLLVTSDFSFFQSVSTYLKNFLVLLSFEIVVCKLFQFGRVQNLLLGEALSPSFTEHGSTIFDI